MIATAGTTPDTEFTAMLAATASFACFSKSVVSAIRTMISFIDQILGLKLRTTASNTGKVLS